MTVDPLEFRSTIGRFATGVTVITSASGDLLHGMTANAITSLSLDPVMLLACIDKTTNMHRVLEDAGVFAVHILAEDQEEISRTFARKGEPERGSLRGEHFRIGKSGAPLLERCLAYFDCRVAGVLEGGDHSIFLGEVIDEGVVDDAARPLIFYRGAYHRLSS